MAPLIQDSGRLLVESALSRTRQSNPIGPERVPPRTLLAIGNLDRGWLVALVWTLGTNRADGKSKMMARFGMILYWCGLAIASMCAIAALTILAAILTNKLSDPEAWIGVMFFAGCGGLAWLAGRAAKDALADI
jgi:hypothetical protein